MLSISVSRTGLIAAVLTLAASGASAQYYPPPGYEPRDLPPSYGPRGFDPRYDAPRYDGPRYDPPPLRRALGGRCEAAIPTGYGSRPLICPIVRARPLDRPCTCPAPPRFGGGVFEGRVIP